MPEVARLAAGCHLDLHLLDLAGPEDPVELGAEHARAGWRVSTSKTGRPITSLAPQPLGAGLPLPVPDLDAVVAVDHVEPDRQAVDDEAGEAALLLDLARLGATSCARSSESSSAARKGARMCRTTVRVSRSRTPTSSRATTRPTSVPPKSSDSLTSSGSRGTLSSDATRSGAAGGRRADRAEAAGPRGPHPEPHPLRSQTLSQGVGHRHQRGFGLLSPAQQLGHRADERQRRYGQC